MRVAHGGARFARTLETPPPAARPPHITLEHRVAHARARLRHVAARPVVLALLVGRHSATWRAAIIGQRRRWPLARRWRSRRWPLARTRRRGLGGGRTRLLHRLLPGSRRRWCRRGRCPRARPRRGRRACPRRCRRSRRTTARPHGPGHKWPHLCPRLAGLCELVHKGRRNPESRWDAEALVALVRPALPPSVCHRQLGAHRPLAVVVACDP